MSFPVYARLIRFESHDAAISVVFDGHRWQTEWQSTQDVRGNVEAIHGASYGVSPWGRQPAPVATAEERLRALVPNADVDIVRNRTTQIGTGRLWRRMENGDEQWSWARVESVPGFTIESKGFYYVPLVLPFTRLSDWYAAEATIVTETLTSSPVTVTAENDGMAETRNIVITLTAHSAGGFSNPSISNTTSAESFTVGRVAASGEKLRIDVLGFRAERSTDGGATWIDATTSLQLDGTQVHPMSLLPGGNVITVAEASDTTIEIQFYEAWR
jgi:hypothetical protein